jgi:oxygen-independent coproporphyrinogen-3 oxidase
MAGLYIHIPFCKSRCIYCAFYSTTLLDLRQRYVDAVCREMLLRPTLPLDTIYLGGGTPSQLKEGQLRKIFFNINKVYSPKGTTPDGFALEHTAPVEVTIECNPDDVTDEFASLLPQLGVNRVSMGVQTFDDRRLRFLHRRHSSSQVQQAFLLLRHAGIRNISLDLMYGFPGETLADWQHDIDRAVALQPEHLSAYCLMVEEGTVLYEQMRNGKWKMRNDEAEELEREMYEVLIDRLASAGYEHYEISNFARPGYRSRHNSSYWHDVPYIGLGAAAHSYDGKARQWNVADINDYMERVEHGELPCDSEPIDETTHYNDSITVALRTSDGLDLSTLPDKYRSYCMDEARRFIRDGLLSLHGNRLVLTRSGLFVSDYVMSALVYV